MDPHVVLKYCLVWSASQRKYMLDKLSWGMIYNAIGHNFSVNESTVYIK